MNEQGPTLTAVWPNCHASTARHRVKNGSVFACLIVLDTESTIDQNGFRHPTTFRRNTRRPMTTMTDQTAPETDSTDAPPFTQAEIDQFDADDVEAGRAICKMLSLFFLYTVIAMTISAIWSYRVIFAD